MLSQVKRRLLHPIFLENAFISPSVARFSSKKGPKEPFVSAEVSKPDRNEVEGDILKEVFDTKRLPKKSRVKTSDEYSDVFDAVLDATFGTSKKQVSWSSKAKPGQLNIKMVKAANSVADLAGSQKKEVLGDIMDKLNSVFPGMENHAKGKRKPFGKNRYRGPQPVPSSFSDEDNLEDIVGMAVAQKGPMQKPRSGDVSKRDRKYADQRDKAASDDIISDEFDAITTALSDQGFSSEMPQSRFMGKRFTTIDQLIKSQKPLGIFTSNLSARSSLSMWKNFEEAQLRRCTRFEPLNWFDQCIEWTEEGKLWHFPINNEQGMDEEAEVDFSEHIFLDHHAEPWCPKEGPIKYFMELVLVGLSKNPYLTVQEKIETINWYREYFMKNKPLLEEINVFGSSENPIEVEGKIS